MLMNLSDSEFSEVKLPTTGTYAIANTSRQKSYNATIRPCQEGWDKNVIPEEWTSHKGWKEQCGIYLTAYNGRILYNCRILANLRYFGPKLHCRQKLLQYSSYHVCCTCRRSPVRARAGAKSASRNLHWTFPLVDSALNEYTWAVWSGGVTLRWTDIL